MGYNPGCLDILPTLEYRNEFITAPATMTQKLEKFKNKLLWTITGSPMSTLITAMQITYIIWVIFCLNQDN